MCIAPQRNVWLATRTLRSNSHGPVNRIQNLTPYFDADRFAQLLEKEGFSAGQAKAVINALDDVVDERYNTTHTHTPFASKGLLYVPYL